MAPALSPHLKSSDQTMKRKKKSGTRLHSYFRAIAAELTNVFLNPSKGFAL
jgi:hypothetical protein